MKHTKESLMELVTGGRALLLSAYEARLETALTEVFAERDELLEALKDVCDTCDWSVDDGRDALIKAVAIIAKAEGEMK
jgi:hypothetical protein